MSIKADKWIRRMAKEQGMIEPFGIEFANDFGAKQRDDVRAFRE